jgi:hypothetical protein
MASYKEFYDTISEVKQYLKRDLFGPIAENEVIEGIEPIDYYSIGILWPKIFYGPQDSFIDSGTDNLAAIDLSQNSTDVESISDNENDSILYANNYKPSALGLSAILPAGAKTLTANFSFAKYDCSSRKIEREIKKNTQTPAPAGEESAGPSKSANTRTVSFYTRKPYLFETSFNIPDSCRQIISEQTEHFKSLGVKITLHVRKIFDDHRKLVTVTVVNIKKTFNLKLDLGKHSLFQCSLSLFSESGFLPLNQPSLPGEEEEEQINSMLYRDIQNYAYGHGCSASFTPDPDRISHIYSVFMPSETVLQVRPRMIKDRSILRLSYWKNSDRSKSCGRLTEFISEYEKWYYEQSQKAEQLTDFGQAPQKVLSRIETCIARLKNGVHVLGTDDNAWKSFLLMNQAMLMQRVNFRKLSPEEAEKVEWHTFQLGYILQIIPDIAGSSDNFRDHVDLLWFPTGGGKTEAYFGVGAFVIFYRRLKSRPAQDGVAIIMRYTLRLLTIQQFERASALICACEYLRKKNSLPGGEISLGLWIGMSTTPNQVLGSAGAEAILDWMKKNPGKRLQGANPIQITACPWCGGPIDIDGYSIRDEQLHIRCNNNKDCYFSSKLPIYVVDSDIYINHPTLIVSTIDKFARLVWETQTKSLFGLSSGGAHFSPPELIIQDELHLISGPLGTLSGLYEIAVDYLCRHNPAGKDSRNNNSNSSGINEYVYPKIIASTATIKHASAQITNLYARPTFLFPPSGLDQSDSFFSVLSTPEERPARIYLGLCQKHSSIQDLMIRIYSNLIFVKHLFIKQQKDLSLIDQFSTIIGYFNSLKDLGTMNNIINDRIKSHIETLVKIKFKQEAEDISLEMKDIRLGIFEELTSRKSGEEIKEILGKLNLPWTEAGYYSVIFASNMLSVGIDIDRLGLMSVYNQPKSNAEYIQATSRIGRQNPGLVITMYNQARSRDNSHYEQFSHYHRTLFKYVESTSVTPFSSRAIEKALHCVFVAIIRLTIDYLGDNLFAKNFKSNDQEILNIIDFITARIADIDKSAASYAADYLKYICSQWEYYAHDTNAELVYQNTQKVFKRSLLVSAEQVSVIDFPAFLNSLRSVEKITDIIIAPRKQT